MSLLYFIIFAVCSIALNFVVVTLFNNRVLKKMKVEKTSTNVITKKDYCVIIVLNLAILLCLHKNICIGTCIFTLALILFVMYWSKKIYYDNLDEYKNKNFLIHLINLLNIDYVASKFSKRLINNQPKKNEEFDTYTEYEVFIKQKNKEQNLDNKENEEFDTSTKYKVLIKQKSKEQNLDNKYKMFIEHKNKYNLKHSLILFGIIFLIPIIRIFIFTIYDIKFDYIFSFIVSFLCVFLFIRFISRVLEIINAFYKDILDNENNSGLKADERLKLAVKSLIEIIVRSATIYLLVYTLNDKCIESLIDNIFSSVFSSVYLSILNSINFGSAYSSEIIDSYPSVYCCADGFNLIYELIRKSVVVLQGVTSFVLIILSFAKYLSSEDRNEKKQHQELEDSRK